MKPRFALSTMLFLAAAASASGCATTPRPVVEDGWQTGAESAASASPTPTVETAEQARALAQRVGAGAMQCVLAVRDASASPDRERSASKTAPAVARAKLAPTKKLEEAPGPQASPETVARWLTTAFERGKSGKWIQRKLNQTKPDRLDKSRVFWTTGDYDADGRADLAAAFFAGCADPACAQGGLWTVGVAWGGGGWSKLAEAPRYAPEFVGPADLTGDKHPELIVALKDCGAHTCFENVQVYTSDGRRPFRQVLDLADHVSGYGGGGLPQEVRIEQPDDESDALPALAISGGLVNSAGAGAFQRSSTVLWKWNEQRHVIEPVETRWQASDLRLHRFHDAIIALDHGDIEKAKAALAEVIDDPTLRELPEEIEPDADYAKKLREQLADTARFELARIALQQGQSSQYDQIRDRLSSSATPGPAARATVKLGAIFEKTSDLAAACHDAAAVFPEKPDDDWVLDAIGLGYNAPVKFTADVHRGLCAGLAPSHAQ